MKTPLVIGAAVGSAAEAVQRGQLAQLHQAHVGLLLRSKGLPWSNQGRPSTSCEPAPKFCLTMPFPSGTTPSSIKLRLLEAAKTSIRVTTLGQVGPLASGEKGQSPHGPIPPNPREGSQNGGPPFGS